MFHEESLANWIDTREIRSRERLVDHENERRPVPVAVGERTTFEDLEANSTKIRGAHGLEPANRSPGTFNERLIDYLKGPAERRATRWQTFGEGHVADSG